MNKILQNDTYQVDESLTKIEPHHLIPDEPVTDPQEKRQLINDLFEWNISIYSLPPKLYDSLAINKTTNERLQEIREWYTTAFRNLQILRSQYYQNLSTANPLRINGGLILVNIRNSAIQGKNHKYSDLYRLLYCRDLYEAAAVRLSQNKGAFTPGPKSDKIKIDDVISEKFIDETIEKFRTFTYKPLGPARRVYVPKPGKPFPKHARPLGIASLGDRLIQEVIRLILDAIFEPTFYQSSHGFRSNRSCHTALAEISETFRGCVWILEGDIKAAFDTMQHNIALNLLRERIKDERFIGIIGSFLSIGYEEKVGKKWIRRRPTEGTPQGNIFSPLLYNIYLHQLDKFIMKYKAKVEYEENIDKKEGPTPHTKIYKSLSGRIWYYESRLRKGNYKNEEYKQKYLQQVKDLRKERDALPTSVIEEEKKVKLAYCRYADDWILGFKGPRSLAVKAKHEIGCFLQKQLGSKLSEEKTLITNLYDKPVLFLGFHLVKPSQWTVVKNPKDIRKDAKHGKVKKKVGHNSLYIYAPIDRVIKRLNIRGFCDKLGNPTPNRAWISHPAVDIVQTYNSYIRGYLNYYSPVQNTSVLMRIQYIIRTSAALTLCAKYKTKRSKLFRKITPNLEVRDKIQTDYTRKVRQAKLTYVKYQQLSPQRGKWKIPQYYNASAPDVEKIKAAYTQNPPGSVSRFKKDPFYQTLFFRTRSKLSSRCCVCGSQSDLQMHHIKRVKKALARGSDSFHKMQGYIKRKAIPLCRSCHQQVHSGKYDGKALKDLLKHKEISFDTDLMKL